MALPIVHAGSPLKTNACINREHAVRCFKAGMTIQQIAASWPAVFEVKIEHDKPVLGQKYDYELGDGSGRYETKRLITRDSVRTAIKRYTGK